MEEKIIDSMTDGNLTPDDFITLMFERTDEDGILYIPGWHYDRPGWMFDSPGSTDENDSYRCRVDWNLRKYEKFLSKFKSLYSALEKIAADWDSLDTDITTAKSVLKNDDLFNTWNTYIRPFDIGEIEYERIADIDDKRETIAWVKKIAEDIVKGDTPQDYEKEALAEYLDVKVTEEEEHYHRKYVETIIKDAETRVGSNICAYDVIVRARRVCRLMSLAAPKIIINNEARTLAAAMLLHEYGISRELVDNSIRLNIERLELMSDEELDELYRPKKTNSRKSMAPLFVYFIIKDKSNSKVHLRQQDILKELEKYPYEITIERKALSRIVHNLTDSQLHVYSDKTGVWMEQE